MAPTSTRKPDAGQAGRGSDWPDPGRLALALAGFILVVCAAIGTLLATGLP